MTGANAPAPPEGWYPEPSGQPAQRWWDGKVWGTDTRPLAPPPAPQAGGPAAGRKHVALATLGIVIGALFLLAAIIGFAANADPSAPHLLPLVVGIVLLVVSIRHLAHGPSSRR